MTCNGVLIATLANDIRVPDMMPATRPMRKPLMFTLPDGRGFLCAYRGPTNGALEIVFPHTTGNVGFANFVYWKRVGE